MQIEDPQARVLPARLRKPAIGGDPGRRGRFCVQHERQLAARRRGVLERCADGRGDDAELRRGRRRQPAWDSRSRTARGCRSHRTGPATLGIEYRSSGQLLDAQPFARFDFAYVGESVNSLEGIESVVSGNRPVVQDAYETGDLRIGLDARRVERVVLRRQRLGRARGALRQQPLGRAASVGQPAADLRAAGQVQILTAS